MGVSGGVNHVTELCQSLNEVGPLWREACRGVAAPMRRWGNFVLPFVGVCVVAGNFLFNFVGLCRCGGFLSRFRRVCVAVGEFHVSFLVNF